LPANALINAWAADDTGLYIEGIWGGLRHLVKLSSVDGGFASGWNAAPAPNGAVYSMVADGAGAVYLGGSFTQIGNGNFARLAKISGADGTPFQNWLVPANLTVRTLALDGAGALYVAGSFGTLGIPAANRPGLAKITSIAGQPMVDAWNPPQTPDSDINAMAADSQALYLGGEFDAVGNSARHGIAKLSAANAALDPDWHPAFDRQYDAIYAIAPIGPTAAGKVLAGGVFNHADGQTRLALALIDASGVPGASVDAEQPGSVTALAVQSNGELIVGGRFLTADGQPRANLLRLKTDGQLDPAWTADSDGAVTALAVDAQDDVFAGGFFEHIGVDATAYLAKLSGDDGANLQGWSPSIDAPVHALAFGAGNSLYIGGDFGMIDATRVDGAARLQADGSLDAQWIPQAVGRVRAIAVDTAHGNVYLAGDLLGRFATANGAARDPNWSPTSDGMILALTLDPNDSLYVGGGFGAIAGQNRSGLAKLPLAGNGTPDANWIPATQATIVDALLLDGAGSLYVGGSFAQMGGQARFNFAQLAAASGQAQSLWNPAPDGDVRALALLSGGRLAVGGSFAEIAGTPREALAVLSAQAAPGRLFRDGFEN
jgi:hypothetical protein